LDRYRALRSLLGRLERQSLLAHAFWTHCPKSFPENCSSVLPFPYGIDVDPKDGSIWYAKLYASKIGRIDPKTLTVTEWDTPMLGPRRLRFDAGGILWIPAFDEGGLMRFDPVKQTFESFVIPSIGEGEYETPYALNVDRRSGDVWMSANNSDRVLRFSPSTRNFLQLPEPDTRDGA